MADESVDYKRIGKDKKQKFLGDFVDDDNFTDK